jgi:sugar diacid utilization regulator
MPVSAVEAEAHPFTQVHEDQPRVIDAFEEVLRLSTSQSADLQDVLRLVGRRLCELLESTRCSVYLRQTDGTFRGQVGWSVDRDIDESIKKLVAGGEGDRFTEEIVSSARPVVIHDALGDPRPLHRTMRRWSVRSMLGVPLVADEDVIGVIYVDNERVPREYDERAIQVAQSFAGLSALVVRQSWQQRRLRENADVMEQQRTVLSESSLVHSRVTRAVLDGAATEEIIGLLASLLHQHVVLYRADMSVVAWSSPDGTSSGPCPALTKQQAATPPVLTAVEHLREGEPSYIVQATRELAHRRLLAGLVVDRQCVGYLELREGRTVFTQIHRRAVEQAAMALSLRTLSTQRSEALTRRERALFLNDLIHGRSDARSLVSRAAEFDVDPSRAHTVVVLHHQPSMSSRRLAALREQGAHAALVAKVLGEGASVLSSTNVHEADLLLVETDAESLGGESGTGVDEQLAERLEAGLDLLHQQLGVQFAVVSETCAELPQIGEATRHARQVTRILANGPQQPRVVATRQLGLLRLIAQRSGVLGAVEYTEQVLAPLTAYDEQHNGELMRTLTTFVECDAQLRRTAARLDVHENTVRYRLRKIREISGIWPDRLESLARVSLALQVRALLQPHG